MTWKRALASSASPKCGSIATDAGSSVSAFAAELDTASVYFTGWYCDGSGAKPSAHTLACLLDKLVLENSLVSKEADSFLRAKLAKPPYCMAEQVTQTTDTNSRRMSSPQRWSQPTAQQRPRY